MNHPDKYKAKRFDTPGRCKKFTDIVYGVISDDKDAAQAEMKKARRQFDPPAPELKLFVGDLHGHTKLSDGRVDIDFYFQNVRDRAKLDFAALTDHDHGGVAAPTLWHGGENSKWELIKSKVREYNEEGKFTTILAYERDSYPFFNNMILYFRTDNADMVIDERPGEFTEECYRRVLASPEILAVPHDTYSFSVGGDFIRLENGLIPPLMEIISRGDPAEYMGNPGFRSKSACEGGFYQDALKKGAKIGCIGGSDDHSGRNGLYHEPLGYSAMYPGVTGVWARANTREDIFDALEQDQQQHYGNWEEVLSVGVAYNINRPIYRDFDTARQCVRDCRVAIEEKKDLTTLKLIFKADKIDNIKTFDNLYSSLVSFLNTKVSALRMDDKAMFKSNFERYIIVCEAVRDSATSFAFSGYVMNHIVGEVNEKRMKNSDASNYIVSIFLLDPTNNRVKDNLKTLFEMLVRENTATSKRTVTTILNKVAACNSSFHGELKKVYEEAQIDVELEGIFKKIKNNSITRLNALKAVHDLYKTNPSNKGVCTVLAQLCVVCIEEYVIGDKYGKEGVKSILNAIKTNKTAQFSSNSNVFSERYHAIWSQLPSEAKQLISLGFGPAGTTLSDKGYALKEGLNLLKDFGGVTNSGLGGGLFDFI